VNERERAALLAALLAEVDAETRTLDLDRFGALVAPHGLSTTELDEWVTRLEEHGVSVEATESPALSRELAVVLPAARRLQTATGKRPTVDAIAREAHVSPEVVWRALRWGRVLGR
jgi:hypothetical protein